MTRHFEERFVLGSLSGAALACAVLLALFATVVAGKAF